MIKRSRQINKGVVEFEALCNEQIIADYLNTPPHPYQTASLVHLKQEVYKRELDIFGTRLKKIYIYLKHKDIIGNTKFWALNFHTDII